MKQQTVVVACPRGLHARVAAQAVRLAQSYISTITVRCGDCPKANACSILEMLALGAQHGAAISIEAEGADENEAVKAMAELFAEGAGI